MFWRIFQKIESPLKKLYKKISQPQIPNLRGDREIEYSWVAANIPEGPGTALDFGCGQGYLGLLAAMRGFKVVAIDLEPANWYYKHPNLRFILGDIFEFSFPAGSFDLIINCSTIEHVGLVGRYRVKKPEPYADIKAMRLLKKIMKPQGVMLLTVPIGRDKTFIPLHRVYGETRLLKLLEGYKVIKKEYWIKNSSNRWNCTEESIAMNKEPRPYCYGLGLFVLQKLC